MGEGVVVDGTPLPIDKGTDEEQEGRLRLVEIGDDGLDDVERVAWCDDNLCGGMEGGETLLREVVEHCLQGFECGELPGGLGIFVGHPLRHMKLFGAQFAPFGLGAVQQHPDIVKALKRPDTGGTHSDAMPPMSHKSLNDGARHSNPLSMHRVAGDVFAFHRFERSGSDVEGQFAQFDAFVLQGLEDRRCEVQSGSGSSHRTFDFGVDRLITFKVSGLGAAIEVGGDGKFTDAFEDFAPADASISPREANFKAGAALANAFRGEAEYTAAHLDFADQSSFFPFLEIADEAGPSDTVCCGKRLLIIVGRVRFEAEDFDECTSRFVEV